MKTFRTLIILTIAFMASACVSPKVVTHATAFFIPEYQSAGSISVRAVDASTNESLEFRHYKKLIEQQLVKQGFEIQPENEADFVAFVSYGIDQGKTDLVTTPVIAQTGGGYRYKTGTYVDSDGPKTYTATSYSMPRYSVVSTSTTTRTVYTRAIALDIVDSKSLGMGKTVKIYEGRAKSTGGCSEISAVFEVMLDALFQDFPGSNGKMRSVSVKTDTDC